MDPDEALKRLRVALTLADKCPGHGRACACAVGCLSDAAEAAKALDDWLSKGGFLPDDWRRKDGST